MNTRKAVHPIDPIFIERWSPRAFTGEAIPDSILLSAFEAARWAPSSANSQPWRFLYSKKDSASWKQFSEFLVEGNRGWAKDASALVFLVSKKDFDWAGKMVESASASLDAGAAWMSLALQIHKLGWATHAMGGIDKEKIRKELNIPANYNVEIGIAIGKQADKSKLPEALQARELPSDRFALEAIVEEGGFKTDWRS